MANNMAISYNMKKKQKKPSVMNDPDYAEAPMKSDEQPPERKKTIEMEGTPEAEPSPDSDAHMCSGGACEHPMHAMADGGMLDEEDMAREDAGGAGDHDLDMVGRIMQKRQAYSKGGQVANDTGEGYDADRKPNQFDDLVLRNTLESSYTGKNSGDELGNARTEQDEKDIVSKIMKSRRLKGRMPSPA